MKHLLFITLFIQLTFLGIAQSENIFYYDIYNRPSNAEKAFISKKIKVDKKENILISSFYKKDNKWVELTTPEDAYFKRKSTIVFKKHDKRNHRLIRTRIYEKIDTCYHFKDYNEYYIEQEGYTKKLLTLELEGELKRFYPNGSIKSIEVYRNNQLVNITNFSLNGEKLEDNVYHWTPILPKYPGGEKSFAMNIAVNINYPNDMKAEGIQGRVIVSYVINTEGELIDTQIIQSVHPSLDKEAIRALKSLNQKWEPGMLNGEKVNVRLIVPINFRLSEKYCP
ncbi:MAG: hypothetical protein DRJ01_07875 [Bacteroidetes bacterium]|nr:MAG: hypothetical protein DRJ01_07875 [Bacteroidota bacterium]